MFNVNIMITYISLGDRCVTIMALDELKLKHETLPFDWVWGTPHIIYDSLKTDFKNFIDFNADAPNLEYLMYNLNIQREKTPSHVNYYGQFFTHFYQYNLKDLCTLLNRRIERFNSLLKTNNENPENTIVFVRSCFSFESSGYGIHLNGKCYFNYLKDIDEYIHYKYPNLKYFILNIQDTQAFENVGNIVNYKIDIDIRHPVKANVLIQKIKLIIHEFQKKYLL